jgi:hypothetical protein
MHTFNAFSAALAVTLTIMGSSASWAQTAANAPPAALAPAPTPAKAQAPKTTTEPSASDKSFQGNQKIERIQLDEGGTRIDELRVGGETQSITVQPKGNMPSYSVQPVSGARTWKILSF